MLESTPQPSPRPQLCPGVYSETSIPPNCLGSVTSRPTEKWDPATPRMKQHCVACIIGLLVLFLALGFHLEMTVSLERPRGTRITPALCRVQEVGGLHGKWSSCLPIICAVSQKWLEFVDTINSAENKNTVLALGGIGLILCKVDVDLSFVSSCWGDVHQVMFGNNFWKLCQF